MEFREFSAKTVDEAITKASLEFEVSSENLEIQIVSEGKTGFLGFGAKPAIIKAAKKEVEKSLPKEPKKKPVEKVKEEVKPVKPAEPEIAKEIEKETEAPREESCCKRRRRNCKYESRSRKILERSFQSHEYGSGN